MGASNNSISGIFAQPPVVQLTAKTISADPGATVDAQVVATGTAPMRFTWLRDGMPVQGETNSSIRFSLLSYQVANSQWVCVVSNQAGLAQSDAIAFSVRPTLGLSATNGTLVVNLLGMLGQTYRLEESTNLVDWAITARNVTSGNQRQIEKPQDKLLKFYRAIEETP
ncbi:MAG: immunoglobulin domain-containing protein [Betaproteobacteria bacterium]